MKNGEGVPRFRVFNVVRLSRNSTNVRRNCRNACTKLEYVELGPRRNARRQRQTAVLSVTSSLLSKACLYSDPSSNSKEISRNGSLVSVSNSKNSTIKNQYPIRSVVHRVVDPKNLARVQSKSSTPCFTSISFYLFKPPLPITVQFTVSSSNIFFRRAWRRPSLLFSRVWCVLRTIVPYLCFRHDGDRFLMLYLLSLLSVFS